MSTETWLEDKKKRVAEQRALFREMGSRYPELEMLSISDTNFLVPEKLARIVSLLESSCADLRHGLGEDNEAWKWGGFFGNLIKIHQLACGEPDNYRSQFLKAMKANNPPEEEKKKKDGLLGIT